MIRIPSFSRFAALHLLLAACSLKGLGQPGQTRYDKETRTAWRIAVDDKALHLKLMWTEPGQQRKVLLNGLECWLDPKAKKNKTTGILFPLPARVRSNNRQDKGGGDHKAPAQDGPPSFSTLAGTDSARDPAGNRKFLQRLIDEQREMQLTGFTDDCNGLQNHIHPSGLHASLHVEGDTLVYEADIPFTTWPPSFNINKPVTIGIIRKGASFSDLGLPDLSMGGPPPGGGQPGDGPPGDGMGLPPGPDPADGEAGQDLQSLFTDDIFWFRVKLF